MAIFSEFLSTFDADAGKRGRQFEHFVKWFLKNDPKWSTQVDQVWLWSEYPENWGRDKGIDLVFKDRVGKTWAVQAKCYSSEYEITKADVDTFLSESNRKHIDHRLLIATTDGLGANGREVLDGQEKPVVRFLLNDFESAAVEYPDSVEHLVRAKRKQQPKPRPHQVEAIDNIVSGFRENDRGQVVMACGTGKTFVCLWVKEHLKATRTLVLLPSLGLLSQTLNEWTLAANERFDALCVCSDQTVGKRDADEAIGLSSELAFPVTSDASEIAEFLRHDRNQVIFSTYQSSPLIAAAQSDSSIPRFDLVIADEAHRCVGKADAAFSTVLDDSQIKADKRLFATATPRVYKTSLKKAAADFGVGVVDMSDPKYFGIRFHTLSFGEAIRRELLTDYRVLIVGVDDRRIAEWIQSRRLVATDSAYNTDAQSLASQIGLLKSIKDWNLRRLISFHGRVKRAKEFSEDIVRVSSWLDEKHGYPTHLWADYVSGDMATVTRKRKLLKLKSVNDGTVGLLANARCLSEGVDVPSLDGIAFIDPRGSEIDIIQSVGRAIRLSENKTVGSIIVPVFVEQNEDAKMALESSRFKPIWDVVEALKSHDERLSNELDQLRIELGATRRRTVGSGDLSKIIFDLPTTVSEQFAEALRVHLVERTTASWMYWYGLLREYCRENGHTKVPQHHKTVLGHKLGQWVGVQRKYRDSIPKDRLTLLEALPGWSWNVFEDAWEDGFSHLTEYVEREGHCRVQSRYKCEDGFQLGTWIQNVRSKYQQLPLSRQKELEALPGWSWNILVDAWETGYSHLVIVTEKQGHCRIPAKYKTPDGYSLGRWVSTQRARLDDLSVSQRQRLEALPGWRWDVLSDSWEEGFSHLRAFVDRTGHCRVTRNQTTDDGFRLGHWVRTQRTNRDDMSSDRRARLEALPDWSWEIYSDSWERAFDNLKAFSEREGHCRVLLDYEAENGFRLGQWVGIQRHNREKISLDRRNRLESLPGWSWDVFSDSWEKGFTYLNAFVEREGHSVVPQNHVTSDGFRLGNWISHQRAKRLSLTPEQRLRFEALPEWSWGPLLDAWEVGYRHLSTYVQKEHHCLIPARYRSPDGYRLGQWISVQRRKRNSIDLDRRARLEALQGWSWDVASTSWEEGFAYLTAYAENNGHCRVPQRYSTDDGFRLGSWIRSQRNNRDDMSSDRRARLEALRGWSWDVFSDEWERGFSLLTAFVHREGHCRVPRSYISEDGFSLGNWVKTQRANRHSMTNERRQRLQQLPGWLETLKLV